MIEIQLDTPQLKVGDRLSGQFTWQPEDAEKMPKQAEVNLSWFTEGRGSGDRQIIKTQPLDLEKLMNFQKRPLPFSFEIPIEVPITYDGYLFRLMWELEVKILFPGIFAPKDRAVCAVQILPR